MASSSQKDLFSSLIADIRNYSGSDPLRPWIQGIRKMREALPPHVLSEKLPRFLQKCAEAFESNRRYRNDSRYLAVWIQLMDYVEDARVILRKMEKSEIGTKRAKFYTAYALFYEKKKRFVEAEKVFHLGAQNLAEPLDELQKSYDQFLLRMKVLKLRRAREYSVRDSSRLPWKRNSDVNRSIPICNDSTLELETMPRGSNEADAKSILDGCSIEVFIDDNTDEQKKTDGAELQKQFVGTCNAMDDINSMFGKPLNFGKARKKKKKKKNQNNPVDGKSAGGDMFFILPDAEMEKNSTGEGSRITILVLAKSEIH
ncbi:checkpoint serine/threonine-protein kinase [Apostasia shenzhenica]|uniref:Checkpoint serine/threonine-protein kinase n=1 Tax=Apostasia shenzhenica TaxID=1088818 RepID=A0A2I0A4X6_9ASPA|nr:checkpoint serine/threonine-protein kinase [Apostasia shenzhenica]